MALLDERSENLVRLSFEDEDEVVANGDAVVTKAVIVEEVALGPLPGLLVASLIL